MRRAWWCVPPVVWRQRRVGRWVWSEWEYSVLRAVLRVWCAVGGGLADRGENGNVGYDQVNCDVRLNYVTLPVDYRRSGPSARRTCFRQARRKWVPLRAWGAQHHDRLMIHLVPRINRTASTATATLLVATASCT